MDTNIQNLLTEARSANPESSLYQILLLMERVFGRTESDSVDQGLDPALSCALSRTEDREEFLRKLFEVIPDLQRSDARASLLSFLGIAFHPMSLRFLLKYLERAGATNTAEEFQSAALALVKLISVGPKSEVRSIITDELATPRLIEILNARSNSGLDRDAEPAKVLLSSIDKVYQSRY